MSDEQNDLVMYRLNTLSAGMTRVEGKVEAILIDVSALKIKAGMWGAIAGAIPGAVAVAIALL